MQEITIGEMLESLREKRGVSKERLSDGICSKITLNRYERDERIPDKFVIDSLLERLEQNPEKLEFIASDEEFQITLYRDEIEEHMECGRFAEAEEVLERYEKEVKQENRIHRQYLQMKYGELFFVQKEYQKALKVLKDALAYTGREEILTKGLEERLLSFAELDLLYKIAETYYKLEAYSCSASLFLMLENYLEGLDEKNEKRLRFFSGDICDVATLARYESGKIEPSDENFAKLMLKMGISGETYSIPLPYFSEKQEYELREIMNNVERYAFGKVAEGLMRLKAEMGSTAEYPENRQCLRRLELILKLTGREISIDEFIEGMTEALRITFRAYNEVHFPVYRIFTENEVLIITMAEKA